MKYIMILILLTGSVLARIGENKEELKKRYGKILGEQKKDNEVILNFKKEGIVIWLFIIKGECQYIQFTKVGGAKFLNKEIELLLESNSLNENWIKRTDYMWFTKKLRAKHFEHEKKLVISTSSFGSHVKKQTENKLKEF